MVSAFFCGLLILCSCRSFTPADFRCRGVFLLFQELSRLLKGTFPRFPRPARSLICVSQADRQVFAADDRMVLAQRPFGARALLDPQQLHLHGNVGVYPQPGQNRRGGSTRFRLVSVLCYVHVRVSLLLTFKHAPWSSLLSATGTLHMFGEES